MIVIDTSGALQWVLLEDDALASENLLGRTDMIAPDVLIIEAANVLAKKVRRKQIGIEQARTGLDFIADEVTARSSQGLIRRAFEMSIQLAHPVYDCVFLACAERENARLVTRDQPLIQRATQAGFGALLQPLTTAPGEA